MAAIYFGWYVVAACGVVACFVWGLSFYGIGVYLHVLSRLHAWPTWLVSLGVTTYYLVGGAAMIGAGRLVDRHGSRGVMVYGACAMAAGLTALGQIAAPWQLFAVFVLLGTAWGCLSATVLTATILPWFRHRQGLAMTLALTGATVGGMVMVPTLVAAVQRVGFPAAAALAGAVLLAVVLPLSVFVIRRPADHAARGGAGRERDAPSGPAVVAGAPWSWREVLSAPLYWTIALPFALALAAQVGFIVHQFSLLAPALGESRAALAVSGTTFAALAGRLAFGLIADRWDARVLSAANIGLEGLALAAMAVHPTPGMLFAASLVLGVAVGNMITLPPLLTRQEFGQRSFGTVFGLVSAATQVGLALGPAVIGVIRDARGSYRPALWLLVALEGLAVAGILWGRRLRDARRA